MPEHASLTKSDQTRLARLAREAGCNPGEILRDVLRDGFARGRHASPSRLKSATCLRPTRSTLAYTLVAAGFRCPR